MDNSSSLRAVNYSKPIIPADGSLPSHTISEENKFHPRISATVQQILKELHKETEQSLKFLYSIHSISVGSKYEDFLKRIDILANALMLVDEISTDELQNLETCRADWLFLKEKLTKAIENREINTNIVEIKKGIEQADHVFIQLGSLAETIIKFQEMSKPLSEKTESFYEKGNNDPLAAIPELMSLFKTIPELEKNTCNLAQNQSKISKVKLQELYTFQLECLDDEIDIWIADTEKSLDGHLKHLKFLLNDKNPDIREKAKRQLGALKDYVAEMWHNSQWIFSLPSDMQSHLKNLQGILNSAEKRIEKLGSQDSAGLVYDSMEWDLLVLSRPAVPQGLLSRVFSYLNPLEYIPEKWRPTNKQIAGIAFLALTAGQEFYNFSNRLAEMNEGHARKLQEEAFQSVPEEILDRINRECARMGTILHDRDLSQVNLPKLMKKYPETLPAMIAAQQKWGNKLTSEQSSEVIEDYRIARTVALSPSSNPYAQRWHSIIMPSSDKKQKSVNSLGEAEVTPSSITKTNESVKNKLEGIGVREGVINEFINRLPSQDIIFSGIEELSNYKSSLENLDFNATHSKNIQDEASILRREVDKHFSDIPSTNCSIGEAASWRQTTRDLTCAVREVVKKASLSKPQKPTDTSPIPPIELLEGEIKLRSENKQLIIDTLNTPVELLNDETYETLIWQYRPDISDRQINDKSNKGLENRAAILHLLLDTKVAYMNALKSHPEFSASCREESCLLFGGSPFLEIVKKDTAVLEKVIERVKFAIKLERADFFEKGGLIERRIHEMKSGESFFFPLEWGSQDSARIMSLEIEKNSDGMMVVRLFDLKEGLKFHGESSLIDQDKNLPFLEFVDINPGRMIGGVFTNILTMINQSDAFNGWDESIFNKLLLPSLGGKISARKDSSSLLRDSQYAENGGMASIMAVLDKTLVSAGLAERMHALTLFRATEAYVEGNLEPLSSGKEREGKRRLALIGVQAILRSIESAIEVGGLIGEEAEELLNRTMAIQNKVSKLQSEDLGVFSNLSLNFGDSSPTIFSQSSSFFSEYFLPRPSINLQKESNLPKKEASKAETFVKPRTASSERKLPTRFVLPPFQNHALKRFLDYQQKQPTHEAANQAAMLNPLEMDEVFQLGTQNARDTAAAGSSNSLKITDNLGLLNQNVVNFFDNDKLRILQELLNNPATLQENLKKDTGLMKALEKFFQNGLFLSQRFQNVPMAGYFAYLPRTILQTIREISDKLGLKLDFKDFPDSSNLFADLIAGKDPQAEKDELKILHFYRIKSFERALKLSLKETAELLSSINYLKTYGLPTGLDVDVNDEMQSIWELVEISQSHLDASENMNKILNAMVHDLDFFHTDCEWEKDTNRVYVNKDQTMSYDAEKAVLERQLLGKSLVPKSLMKDPLFQAFVDSQEGVLDRIENNIFIYTDAKGSNYRFIITKKEPITQREFNGKWYQALNPKEIISLPLAKETKGSWNEGGVLWTDDKGKYFFTAPGGSALQLVIHEKIEHSTHADSYVENAIKIVDKAFKNLSKVFNWARPVKLELVTQLGEATGLSFFDSSNTSLSAVISNVEKPEYSLSFSKNDRLVRMELPRLGLVFENTEPGKGEMILPCNKLDGFGLHSGTQALPLLGDFHTYLPLKRVDAKNNQEDGLIIPALPFTAQKTDGLKTPTTLATIQEGWKEKVPYYFYKIKDGILIPQVKSSGEALKAYAHAATIFLSERKYEEAVKYIDKIDGLLRSLGQKVDKEGLDALKQIVRFFNINKDYSPNGAAIRLQAAALLIQSANLDQTEPIDNEIRTAVEKDYMYYSKQINLVNNAFRLIEGEKILSRFLELPRPHLSKYSFPGSYTTEQISHPVIPIEGAQKIESASEESFTFHPTDFSSLRTDPMNFATSLLPVLVERFPEGILPLYKLFDTPHDLRESEKNEIARSFGLDTSISGVKLKSALITLLEFRYRFLIDFLEPQSIENKKKLKKELSKEERKQLGLEVNLIGSLLLISKDEKYFKEIERDSKHHSDLLAALRILPEYSKGVKIFEHPFKWFKSTLKKTIFGEDDLKGKLSSNALKEALRLWNSWVVPKAVPFQEMSISHTSTITESVVGPILTHPLLDLTEQKKSDESFAASYAAALQTRPATIAYGLPSTFKNTIDKCFTKHTIVKARGASCFNVKAKEPYVARIFEERNKQYADFISKNPPSTTRYVLDDQKQLKKSAKKLTDEIGCIQSNIDSLERALAIKLNRDPKSPSLHVHKKVRIARQTVRELTIEDAKLALAKGFDVEHLHALHPGLSFEEISEIFEMTLKLMLEQREYQNRQRVAGAINSVIKGDPIQDAWHMNVENLLKAVHHKSNYDPYKNPVLLLAETEYNIALWKKQIPAIMRLTPSKQISALIELAMGLGKTAVISPVVLSLLADSKKLVILGLPEGLVKQAMSELQERLHKLSKMKVRHIPIERGAWSTKKIDAFKDELSLMMEGKTPLIWSSEDIQTLINSCFESMQEIENPPGPDDLKKVAAWQRLFHLLRNSSEIIGDEIHRLLDILTSYNFALGMPQPLPQDERDAVADFAHVVLTHPQIVDKVSFAFSENKGVPFTDDYFKEVLKPKIIEMLIKRGITNDLRSKELVERLAPNKIDLLKGYLSSVENDLMKGFGLGKMSFFPVIDAQIILRLAKGQNLSQEEIKGILSTLLPSDQEELANFLKKPKVLAEKLTELSEIYTKLETRFYNFLATQKESLRTVFALTAMARMGKHYALNKHGTAAIPADDGNPLWDSKFGSSLEELYYALFGFFQKGISKEIVKKDLKEFLKKHQKTITESTQKILEGDFDPGLLNDNELTNAFKERYGDQINFLKDSSFTSKELELLTNWVNEKPERQIPFIRDWIFKELKSYPEEIETTTHMFTAITKLLKGMTGTLYNKATFPCELNEEPFMSDTIPLIVQRIKESTSNEVMTISTSGTSKEILDRLYLSNHGPGSIIDTTGYIKKESTEAYARMMLKALHEKNPKITGVVFFDGDIPKVINVGVAQPSLFDGTQSPDSLAALFDVTQTIGANIIIRPDAFAFFIVGKDSILFNLLQAAMRARGLGAGQRLVMVVSEADRLIMAEKLFTHLGIVLKEGEPLTVDMVIQYALLNEVLEETGNNWRAIDMRMRMAVLNPLLSLVWNVSTPPEDALNVFNLIKGLFIKKRNDQPWNMYGRPILKTSVEEAMKELLKEWTSHPILEVIKSNSKLFSEVKVDSIINNLKEIAASDPGPLQPLVDSENSYGLKQQTKTQEKQDAKVKQQAKVKQREKVKKSVLGIKKPEVVVVNQDPRNLPPLRRAPYNIKPSIPIANDLFSSKAHDVLSLEEASGLTVEELQPFVMDKRGVGAAISASEFLSLIPSLNDTLQIDEAISVSLNVAPVWKDKNGSSPLYTPYYSYQKFPSHALLSHDKKSDKFKLTLVDTKEAEAILDQLEKDRSRPNAEHEVHLSLYHLKGNRIIASGNTSVNPKEERALKTRMHELISQAKLLSGITQFSKEESKSLEQWITTRNPQEILQKFVFQIAWNREETLASLPKSGLGKLFQKCGIAASEIEELVKSPRIACVKDMEALLFDQALILKPEEWLNKANSVKDAIGGGFKDYAAQWSNVAAPLLPVLFDILHSDSQFSFNSNEKEFKVIQRHWVMDNFFPSMADELAALKTALPQMRGKLDQPEVAEKGILGNDGDLTHLERAFKVNERIISRREITSLGQLEEVSGLLHPIWGLPSLRSSHAEDKTEFHKLGVQMGNQALDHVLLTTSLKAVAEKHSDYEFERLYGIFAFATAEKRDFVSRNHYALNILPRLFGDKLGSDMRFYANFIPQSLINYPEISCSKQEIQEMLGKCYQASTPNWIFAPANEETNISTESRFKALAAFAKEASPEIAKMTGGWLNLLLKSNPSTHSFIDMMLFQLLQRKEPLIDHQAYRDYFAKSSSQHIEHAQLFKTTSLSDEEFKVVKHWNLKDFDLFADVGSLTTADKPPLNPYERAQKWTDILKAVKERLLVPNSLWHKVLSGISEKVKTSPPTSETEKAALRGLIKVLDEYSEKLLEADFEYLQNELGNIRLAADYSFDLAARREFTFKELKKLPSQNEHLQRIYNYFIPNFLLTSSEVKTIPPQSISGFFNDLYEISKNKPSYDYYKWQEGFGNIMNAFTLDGTAEQKNAFLDWSGSLLNRKKTSSEMSDYTMVTILNHSPQSINHSDLVKYVKNRKSFIDHLIDTNEQKYESYKNIIKTQLADSDFELFADLFELKTRHREALSYNVLINKISPKLENFPFSSQQGRAVLVDLLKAIESRAALIPAEGEGEQFTKKMREEALDNQNSLKNLERMQLLDEQIKILRSRPKRNKAQISNLIKEVEKLSDSRGVSFIEDQNLIAISNQLRLLSDYSNPNANVNLGKAIKEVLDRLKVPSEPNFHTKALTALITDLKLATRDDSWMVPTFLNVLEAWNVNILESFMGKKDLSPDQKAFLDQLFVKNTREHLSSMINAGLKTLKKQSPIIKYFLQKISPDFSQINHEELKNYFNAYDNNQHSFMETFLIGDFKQEEGFFGKNYKIGDRKIEAKLNLCGNDFDLFAEVFDLKTENRQPHPYDVFANKLVKSKKFKGQDFHKILDRIAERAANVRPEILDNQAISNLIKKIDQTFKLSYYYPSDLDNLIESSNKLRLLIDFPPPNHKQNLIKAVSIAFGTSSDISPFQREAIAYLIPELKNKASKYKEHGEWLYFSTLLETSKKTTQLTKNQISALKDLFYQYKGGELPALIDKALPTFRAPSVVVDHLLKEIKDFLEINHSNLKHYFNLMSDKNKNEFFESLVTKNELVLIANGDFDVLTQLGSINTKNKPSINVEMVTKNLEKFLGGISYSMDQAVSILLTKLPIIFFTLNKIKESGYLTSNDKSVVSSLIKKLDRLLPGNLFSKINWESPDYNKLVLQSALDTICRTSDYSNLFDSDLYGTLKNYQCILPEDRLVLGELLNIVGNKLIEANKEESLTIGISYFKLEIYRLIGLVNNYCHTVDLSSIYDQNLIKSYNQLNLLLGLSNINNNIKTTALDLLDFSKIDNFRSEALKQLIPELLEKAPDNSWVEPTFLELVKEGVGQRLSSHQMARLDQIFLSNNRELLPALINQQLPTLAASSIVDYFLKKISPDFSQISYENLKTYFDRHGDKWDFLSNLFSKNEHYKTGLYSDFAYDIEFCKDFEVVANLFEMNLEDRPLLSLEEIANKLTLSYKNFQNAYSLGKILRLIGEKIAAAKEQTRDVKTIVEVIQNIENAREHSYFYKVYEGMFMEISNSLRKSISFPDNVSELFKKTREEPQITDISEINAEHLKSKENIVRLLLGEKEREGLQEELAKSLENYIDIDSSNLSNPLITEAIEKLINLNFTNKNGGAGLASLIKKLDSLDYSDTQIKSMLNILRLQVDSTCSIQKNDEFSKAAAEWLLVNSNNFVDFSILSEKLFIHLLEGKVPFFNYSEALTIWKNFNTNQKNSIVDTLNGPSEWNRLFRNDEFLLLAKLLELPVNHLPELTLIDLYKDYWHFFLRSEEEKAFVLCDLVMKRLPKPGEKKLSSEEVQALKEILYFIKLYKRKFNEKSIKIMESYV